ncbi:hypothetical protein EVG20_g8487 [Dentipellis fragilis]|uniref:Uncharacterized protein n=1 Tax=Dentipellis fragilis TaxID=205917 RepID=A0A4Y9Y830_9AGAM|nr:hypothetical protein EVG20_g8487 [Dentipellis fragilis]
MDASREEYPKISVDSRQDWERVKTNFSTAVYAHLEELMGGLKGKQKLSAGEEANLRANVQRFVDLTFEKAKPNLRVNGRDLEDADEDADVEPFDEALDRHIWSLSDQRLKCDRELANKRRTRPEEIVTLLNGLFELQREEEGALEPDIEDEQMDVESGNEQALVTVEETFAELSSMTGGLQQAVQTQLERLERLQVVDKEIKALEP